MKLTQTVKKGGCAAKVPALMLREILAGVRFPPTIAGVSVDGSLFDDAAIFEIDAEHALVQTLDFFTPILDDAYDFGAVAAANSLSDVYAMGGKPKTCMAILAAPLAVLEASLIQQVLQGASDVIEQSHSSLVGGHSIDDDTLKFGLSVTGLVHPKKIWKNDGACPGDHLILTKPLGTGTLCAGLKREAYSQADIKEAIDSMKRLNNIIDFLSHTDAIHAATDITGFGLAGHAYQLARASKVTLRLQFQKLPLFQKTMDSLALGHLTKAHRSNHDYTQRAMQWADSITELERLVLFDPQTSGGLLLSVSPAHSDQLLSDLAVHFPGCARIGEVQSLQGPHVFVV